MALLFSVKINRPEFGALLEDLVEVNQDAIRPAVQAGAQVIYDQVERNVDRIGVVSGNLARSIYQVYSKDNSGPGRAEYHISWNASKAQHGGLLEYGHIQKYQSYINSKGEWKTRKRPGLPKGTKPPGRDATEAEKDAYYMPRKEGPVQWLGKAFLRGAYESHSERAMDVIVERYLDEILGSGT